MKIRDGGGIRCTAGSAEQRRGQAAQLIQQLCADCEIAVHCLRLPGKSSLLRSRQRYLPDVELNALMLQSAAQKLGLLTVRRHPRIHAVSPVGIGSGGKPRCKQLLLCLLCSGRSAENPVLQQIVALRSNCNRNTAGSTVLSGGRQSCSRINRLSSCASGGSVLHNCRQRTSASAVVHAADKVQGCIAEQQACSKRSCNG
ncbi:hypothetical protein D3C75_550320 [compost metagenome]